MSIAVTPQESAVPCFPSVEALDEGLEAKANYLPVDLYPRDGSRALGEVERRIEILSGSEYGSALAFNSGMAATTSAIETAIYAKSDNTETVLACARELYTQTKKYIGKYVVSSGIKVVYFDSGNPKDIESTIEKRQPDIIVGETIGNFINVPVLDTEHLLSVSRSQKKQPIIVLDNTLPLSSALPLYQQLEETDQAIIIESGTKSYTFNSELLGLTLTKSPQLNAELRERRRTTGSSPGVGSLRDTLSYLPENKACFDDRNLKIYKNTARLALALAHVSRAEGSDFIVSHPGTPEHDNFELYSREYPNQGTPVFYIQSSSIDQRTLAKRLWKNPLVREHAQLGQSFGFDQTRILADENVGAVRISGGAKTDITTLAKALSESITA